MFFPANSEDQTVECLLAGHLPFDRRRFSIIIFAWVERFVVGNDLIAPLIAHLMLIVGDTECC